MIFETPLAGKMEKLKDFGVLSDFKINNQNMFTKNMKWKTK